MTTPKITTIKPEGDEGPRYYVFEGSDKPIPGVTSVLSSYAPGGGEGLLTWSANEAAECAVRMMLTGGPVADPDATYRYIAAARKRSRDASAERGTAAHGVVEDYAFSTVTEMRKAWRPGNWALQAWAAFVKDFNVRVLYSEVSIYSNQGYMGSTDLIVEMDTPWLGGMARGTVIIDTKTGAINNKVALQLAAYRYGDYIITDIYGVIGYAPVPAVNAAAVFRPREDGQYDLVPVEAGLREHEMFLSLLTLFEWEKGAGKAVLGKAVKGRKTKPRKAPIDWLAGASIDTIDKDPFA